MLLDATFTGTTRADCTSAGACWVFVKARFGQFMYGLYPPAERWRVDLAGVDPRRQRRGAVVEGAALPPRASRSRPSSCCRRSASGCSPAASACAPVETREWGGLMLTIFISIYAGLIAIPLGILLALGRQSRAAGHPHDLGDLHRVLARRADRRGDLPRLDPAAADHAVRRRRRSPRARRDRARPRDRRLHGGSRARRPAGGARGPARGRDRARPRLLARDRLHRAAAGDPHCASRHDQRVHRAGEEHHAGADRLDPRPARHRAGRARRSELGRHEQGGLCVRRADLLARLLRPLARRARAGAQPRRRANGDDALHHRLRAGEIRRRHRRAQARRCRPHRRHARGRGLAPAGLLQAPACRRSRRGRHRLSASAEARHPEGRPRRRALRQSRKAVRHLREAPRDAAKRASSSTS